MKPATSRRITLLALLWLVSTLAVARQHNSPAGVAAEPGQFDYYLLTLSWSPTFCLTHTTDQSQCGGKGYGFVLHGLWPQFDAGGYPEDCSVRAPLPAAAATLGSSIYPSPVLMRHEWQAHGTCTGLDAKVYFQAAQRALAVIRTPPLLYAPREPLLLTANQIIARFRAANPSLPPNGLVVACSRGELSEVRVCLTRELKPRACGRGVRSTCQSAPVEVPSTR